MVAVTGKGSQQACVKQTGVCCADGRCSYTHGAAVFGSHSASVQPKQQFPIYVNMPLLKMADFISPL